jgi:hypothetical protein
MSPRTAARSSPAAAATAGSDRTRRDLVPTGHGDVRNAVDHDGPASTEWEDAGVDRLTGGSEALELHRKHGVERPQASFDAAVPSTD